MKDTRQVGEAGAAGNKREEKVGQKEVEAVKGQCRLAYTVQEEKVRQKAKERRNVRLEK